MNTDDQVGLVRALAELAGRSLTVRDARRVVDRAAAMTRVEANEVWTQHRVAPHTVALHPYLAMTLRFVLESKRGRWAER